MKLEGSLETFPLRELVEMIIYSSVTGALNVDSHDEHGRLYFREGTLYHVERGQTEGIEALAQLLELRCGTFSFTSNVKTEAETLWGSLAHHLQAAERLASRWRMTRPYVPHLNLTPTLIIPRETAARRVGPAHQPVLGAIDGQASLRTIAAGLGWAEIDVAEAIVLMTVDGLIDLRNTQPGAMPQPHADLPPPVAGIFDRLRSGHHAEHARTAESRTPEELILRLLRAQS